MKNLPKAKLGFVNGLFRYAQCGSGPVSCGKRWPGGAALEGVGVDRLSDLTSDPKCRRYRLEIKGEIFRAIRDIVIREVK